VTIIRHADNIWHNRWGLKVMHEKYKPQGRTRVLAEPFLSLQHCTGLIGEDEGKAMRCQDTSNAKSLGEVATQT